MLNYASTHYHNSGGERTPLVGDANTITKQDKQDKVSCSTWVQKGVQVFFGIKHEPTRATVAGVLVGLIVGLNCMLLPHNLFWGEAQLQVCITFLIFVCLFLQAYLLILIIMVNLKLS